MNLGRTLVGAAVGVVVAIAIYVGIRLGTNMQATWFPIITGLLVGLGVRQATPSGVSYLRGGLSALIAAGAIFGSDIVAQQAITRDLGKVASTPANLPASDSEEATADEDAEGDAALETDTTTSEDLFDPELLGSTSRNTNLELEPIDKGDVWPFLFMAAGIFLAYEFARGSASREPQTNEEPTEDGSVEDEQAGDEAKEEAP